MSAAVSRRRWVVVALAALLLSGFAGSYLLLASGWRPETTKNYGELVRPARPLHDAALVDLDGETVRLRGLRGKWTWMYFGPAACPRACADNLYKMRQLTAAQGRDAHRVQRVFVVTNGGRVDPAALADYPGTLVLRGSPAAVREVARQFALPAGTPLDGLDRLYLVDPLGNFMMSYPADADLRRINKDLKLLLRASHVG